MGMMKRLAIYSLTAVLCCAVAPSVAAAQEPLKTVKQLYGEANYEDALAALDKLPSETVRPEVEQYRVLSLTALGRSEEAQKVMEGLIRADPSYALDPSETPPRVREAFSSVRQKLLPGLTRQLYFDARAALDRRDRDQAIAMFEKVIAIIDSAGNAAGSSAELRILADGFLDLSRALPRAGATAPTTTAANASPEPAAPTPSAPPPPAVTGASARPTSAAIAAAGAIVETRPVALNQELPVWQPGDSLSRRGVYNGAVLVRIGTDGKVHSAEITKSVHPTYDSSLLRAARNWRYQPAKRGEVPVPSELTVEVNLRPPQ
jgi:periplasmic protein TonB